MTPAAGGRRRRILLTVAMALCSLAVTVSACGSNSTTAALACRPNTGASTISGDITVTYSASLVQTGAVNSISYATDAGPVVVHNPTMPWELTLVLATSPAAIRAEGRVTTGSITVGYSATGAPNRAEQNSATCEMTSE